MGSTCGGISRGDPGEFDSRRRLRGQETGATASGMRQARAVEMKQICRIAGGFQGSRPQKNSRSTCASPRCSAGTIRLERTPKPRSGRGDERAGLALVALEFYPQSEAGEDIPTWACEFMSLAPEPLEIQGGEGFEKRMQPRGRTCWPAGFIGSPESPGSRFAMFRTLPPPAQSPQTRLNQMRDLIRRFAATEHATAQPTVLRLMPHPIDRYSDLAAADRLTARSSRLQTEPTPKYWS